MKMIEIAVLENGAHRNQSGNTVTVPEGWAVLPDDMETPNFPFGEITVDNSDPPMVTSWTPGTIPEPEPEPEAVDAPTEIEQLRADVDYLLMMEEG